MGSLVDFLEVSPFSVHVQWAWQKISVFGDNWARVRVAVPKVPACVTEFPGVRSAVPFQGFIGLSCGFLLEDASSREGQRGRKVKR